MTNAILGCLGPAGTPARRACAMAKGQAARPRCAPGIKASFYICLNCQVSSDYFCSAKTFFVALAAKRSGLFY